MVVHRHLCAAVVDRGLRGIHTSWRRRRNRMNRGPNEEGKAGQDNEQPPEDQDPHAATLPRSLPPFKVRSTGRTSSDKLAPINAEGPATPRSGRRCPVIRTIGGSSMTRFVGKVLVATKARFRTGDGPNDAGSSRYHLVEACDASLKRRHRPYRSLSAARVGRPGQRTGGFLCRMIGKMCLRQPMGFRRSSQWWWRAAPR
jgi:hypothetical protein